MDNYDLSSEGVVGAGRLTVLEYQSKRDPTVRVFNNLYVKNFPAEITEERLVKMFEFYGEINNVCIMKDDEGNSKGFGFVCMKRPEDAANAVNQVADQLAKMKAEPVEEDGEFDEEFKTNFNDHIIPGIVVCEAKKKFERDQET